MANKEILKEIEVKDLIGKTRIVIKIKGLRIFSIRFKVFYFILKLACKLSPIPVDIEWINKGA